MVAECLSGKWIARGHHRLIYSSPIRKLNEKKVFAFVLFGVESSDKRSIDSKKNRLTMFHWDHLTFTCLAKFLLENHLGDLLVSYLIF